MTVKEARERLGKTQAEMAELLHISRNYLALIETGKRPQPADLTARALELVEQSQKELTAGEWRARALAAESKLAGLKKVLLETLDQYYPD